MSDRYWVGGTGTWSTTNTANWSTTSGGAGGASVPTAADSVFFDQAGTYTVSLYGALYCLDFNVSAGNVTFSGLNTSGNYISGNMTITNVTPTWSATGTIIFNATSAKTITTNGTMFACPIQFDGIAGSWTLQDALTTDSTRTVTLTNGTLSLGSNTLTCGLFSSSNSNTRTLDFGTGAINLTGSGATIYTTNTLTNLTILPDNGPRQVSASYSGSTGTRSFLTGSGITEPYAIDVSIVAGSDTVTLYSARNINFTGFSGTWGNNARTIYGNLTLSSTMTLVAGTSVTTFGGTSATPNTITTNGQVLDFPVTISSVGGTKRLQDALTIGSTRALGLSFGALDLNGYTLTAGTLSLSGSGVRSIAFGTGRIVTTNSNAISAGTLTNFTLSGTPRVDITAASAIMNVGQVGATGTNVFDIYCIGSGPFPNTATNQRVGTLSLASATGAFTFTSGFGIYRDLILPPSVDPVSSSATLTFLSTSATPRSVTSNGRTINFPVTFNGVGGSWALQDAMLLGPSYALTLTNGTLDLNGKTLTVGTSFAIAAGTKSVTFNGGVIVCPASTTTAFNNAVPTNFTTSAGSAPGTISMTGASAKTFVGGGSTYAATLNQGGGGALTVAGANTFADLTATVTPSTISLAANQTFSDFTLSGTGPAGVVTFNSTVSGTQRTISKVSGSVLCSYLSVRDSAATGGATWVAQLSTDAGNNTGWAIYSGTAPLSVPVLGNSAVGYVGTVTVPQPIAFGVTGVQAYALVGSVVTTAGANATLTGLSATGYTGTITVIAGAVTSLTGLSATGSLGTVTTSGKSNITLAGVVATGYVGAASVSGKSNLTLTGTVGTGAVGTVTERSSYYLSGVSAIATAGTITAKGGATLALSGVYGTGYTTTVLVWGLVDDSQTANWTPVNDSDTVVWTQIPT